MSLHSYSKCWIHMIWGTLDREKIIGDKETQRKLANYFYDYSRKKNIFMKCNYVNSDHVHALIDIPTSSSLEEVFKLFKGSSSHWITENNLIDRKFSWGRGYGAFSVSESNVEKVIKYIEGQEEHHRKKSFTEEYKGFIKVYGLRYIKD